MEPPSNIAILDPDQNEALDALKLEGSQNVQGGDDGTVTLRHASRAQLTDACAYYRKDTAKVSLPYMVDEVDQLGINLKNP